MKTIMVICRALCNEKLAIHSFATAATTAVDVTVATANGFLVVSN